MGAERAMLYRTLYSLLRWQPTRTTAEWAAYYSCLSVQCETAAANLHSHCMKGQFERIVYSMAWKDHTTEGVSLCQEVNAAPRSRPYDVACTLHIPGTFVVFFPVREL